MKMTKGVVDRKEAMKLAPDYVAFAEGDFDKYDAVDERFANLRIGQKVLTFVGGVYVIAKVSSVQRGVFRAVDGPVVRVSNGECSWRVDGSKYAYPV